MHYLAKSWSSTRFRRDERTWRHRLTGFHQSWRPLIDGMADGYIGWKYGDDPGINSTEAKSPPSQPPQSSSAVNDFFPAPSAPNNDSPSPRVPATTHDGMQTDSPSPSAEVEISVIDIYTLSTSIKFPCAGDQTTASVLAGLGFIGNAPFHPSVAVSMKTVELYRIVRRRKPSFSVEAFVKVICDLYMVCVFFSSFALPILIVRKIPYRPKYRRLFSDAFDVYLEVIRVVDERVKVALGHDGPNWRVLNACPACSYEVCPGSRAVLICS